MSEQDNAYRRAKKQVDQIRAWFILMAIYAVMTPVFFFIDVTTGGGVEWAHWAVFGCAMGAAIHTAVVWGPPFGQRWEQRKISELMEQERQAIHGSEDPETDASRT